MAYYMPYLHVAIIKSMRCHGRSRGRGRGHCLYRDDYIGIYDLFNGVVCGDIDLCHRVCQDRDMW